MAKKNVIRPYDITKIVVKDCTACVEKDYRLVRDSHMNAEYIAVGEKNVTDYINSFKAGASLRTLLERCSLMPVNDKIAYLQQNNSGVSADLTALPKDGTESFMLIDRVKRLCPDLSQRLNAGESFEDIVMSMLPKKIEMKEEVTDNGQT